MAQLYGLKLFIGPDLDFVSFGNNKEMDRTLKGITGVQ